MSQEERNRLEVEQHAQDVFARLAASPRVQRSRRQRVRVEKPQPAPWFSGVEAALPRGDRD